MGFWRMEREISEELARFAETGEGATSLAEPQPRTRFAFHVPRVVDHFALAFVLYFLV